MDFSVVVPVYNNQPTLKKVYRNIIDGFSSFSHHFQIIFVDDGSDDQSYETLQALKMEDARIAVVQLQNNYNQSVAIFAGLQHAIGKNTIIISADLQEEERFIEKLLAYNQLFPEVDLVIGYRTQNSDYPIFRILSRLFYRIIQLKIPKMPNGGFDAGIIGWDVKQKFINQYYDGIFIQAALVQLAKEVRCVEYHRKKSAATNVRLKSIYFKLKYFLSCIASVYLPKRKPLRQNGPIYVVKNYLP